MLAEGPFSEVAWLWLLVPAEPCPLSPASTKSKQHPLQISTPAQSLLRAPNTAQSHPQPALSRVTKINNQSFLFGHESINSAVPVLPAKPPAFPSLREGQRYLWDFIYKVVGLCKYSDDFHTRPPATQCNNKLFQ